MGWERRWCTAGGGCTPLVLNRALKINDRRPPQPGGWSTSGFYLTRWASRAPSAKRSKRPGRAYKNDSSRNFGTCFTSANRATPWGRRTLHIVNFIFRHSPSPLQVPKRG